LFFVKQEKTRKTGKKGFYLYLLFLSVFLNNI